MPVGYRVEFSLAAERELRKLTPKLSRREQKRLVKCIEGLADDPYPEGAKKLIGAQIYRVRSGDYRIAYTVRARKLIVLILKVGNRKEFYDRIKDVEKRAKTLLK